MSAAFDTSPGLARWRSRWLLALALAGLVFGLAVVALTLSSDHEEDRGLVAAVSLLVGWSFIGTGLFAWWRRPGNRTGALMTAVGFAWFASGLSEANDDLLFTIGIAVDSLFPGLAGHLLLAFPSGRLEGRAERWTVAGGLLRGHRAPGPRAAVRVTAAGRPAQPAAGRGRPGPVGPARRAPVRRRRRGHPGEHRDPRPPLAV